MKLTTLTGIIIIIATVILTGWMIVRYVVDSYDYNNSVGSYWNLSIKASSLDVKSQYLDQFISALQSANLSGNDALFFPTPNNSYTQNMEALTSLQQRMHQWLGQDETSMAYQQAISQITAQEQDDNGDTIQVLQDLWWKDNHYAFWNGFMIVGEGLVPIIGIVIGCGVITVGIDDQRRRA